MAMFGFIAAAFVACALVLSSLTAFTGSTAFQMVPGNTVLGNFNVYNIVTCHFVETAASRFLIAAVALLALAQKVERAHPGARVLAVVLAAALASGIIVSFAGLMAYMSAADEVALYRPRSGMSGLVGAYAILAWQAAGDGPVFPDTPWLPCSTLPLLVMAVAGWLQYIGGVGSDFGLCVLCTLLCWVQVRFIVPVSPGGPAGDSRPELDLLNILPSPLRTPLRPLEKLASTIGLPLARKLSGLMPAYVAVGAASGVSGGGFGSLPMSHPSGSGLGGAGGAGGAGAGGIGAMFRGSSWGGGYGEGAGNGSQPGAHTHIDLHVHWHAGAGGSGGRGLPAGVQPLGPLGGGTTSIYVGDPIAERKREKALKLLDKRMAELRNKMKGTGAVPAALGSPLPRTGPSASP